MSDPKMSEQEMIAAIKNGVPDADPLTKAWARELLRIGDLADREPWEELLPELTSELETTMNKITHKRSLTKYDRFLIDVLHSPVLPNPRDPQGGRDKALAMFVEKQTLGGAQET